MIMPKMTDEEADALDKQLTGTTPKLTNISGIFARQRALPDALDPVTANYIHSQAELKHLSPSEIVGGLAREKFDLEAEALTAVSKNARIPVV
jgi:hypothetical protein